VAILVPLAKAKWKKGKSEKTEEGGKNTLSWLFVAKMRSCAISKKIELSKEFRRLLTMNYEPGSFSFQCLLLVWKVHKGVRELGLG
jgi:hypothetical protein